MNNSSILKEQTKGLHDNVERVMNSSLLFSNQFTVEHYKNFIQKSFQYITSICELNTIHWPEYKSIVIAKQKALDLDLEHLKLKNQASINPINSSNAYYELGLIYIVLGAMLGNKIILSKLKQSDNFSDFPFSYLSEHQENLSVLWKSFQITIDNLDQNQLNQVILGAQKGYSLFGQ